MNIPNDFNYYGYIYNNEDLRFLNKNDAFKHYLKHGKREGRSYSISEIGDFNPYIYKNMYSDINNLTDEEAILHFLRNGRYEGRTYKIDNLDDFDVIIYKSINLDLKDLTDLDATLHYIRCGKKEGREYKRVERDNLNSKTYKNNVSNNEIFNIMDDYLNNLTNDAILHYMRCGKYENSPYKCMKINNNYEEKKPLISIVMTYFNNRKKQTIRTLDGFQKNYYNKYEFEVIIVDDASDKKFNLDNDIVKYNYPINLIKISKEEKGNRTNPCIPYNVGFRQANGKIIIIQNPECYHATDILGYTLENLTEQDYFSFSCYSGNSEEITKQILESDNIYDLILDKEFDTLNHKIIDCSWYNHPTILGRTTNYHFCSAIYKSKLDLIGGFNEEFANGYCYDDDELLLSIKYNLNLNINTIDPSEGLVIHQYHTRSDSFKIIGEDDSNTTKIKWLKNKYLYENMKLHHEKNKFNYPKLLHLYWDGSPLSYLNLITVLSFNEYHKYWKINVYFPNKRTEKITWLTHEQKIKYEKKSYIDVLRQIPNVNIHYIDLDDIGFYNDASEVIKSDYFRYYILQKHGGVWSDFDIVYTNSVEKKSYI